MRRRDSGHAIDAFADLPPRDIMMEGFEDDEADDTPTLTIPSVKILVVGAVRTGKTSLINAYIQHAISDVYEPTQGYDSPSVEVKLHYSVLGTSQVKQEIWDTSGNPACQSQLESYYKSAKAVMMVFDPAVASSFTH